MARYSLGVAGGVGTTGVTSIELRAPSATVPLYLRECGIFLTAATASTFGLGQAAAQGVTPTTPIVGLAENSTGTAVGATAIAWGTAPTIPVQFYRRIALPAAIGNGVIWTFTGDGLLLPPSKSLVIWNLATNGVITGYFVWNE